MSLYPIGPLLFTVLPLAIALQPADDGALRPASTMLNGGARASTEQAPLFQSTGHSVHSGGTVLERRWFRPCGPRCARSIYGSIYGIVDGVGSQRPRFSRCKK